MRRFLLYAAVAVGETVAVTGTDKEYVFVSLLNPLLSVMVGVGGVPLLLLLLAGRVLVDAIEEDRPLRKASFSFSLSFSLSFFCSACVSALADIEFVNSFIGFIPLLSLSTVLTSRFSLSRDFKFTSVEVFVKLIEQKSKFLKKNRIDILCKD